MNQEKSDCHTQAVENRLAYKITTDKSDIIQAQQLRYRVFAEDMGADLPNSKERLDYDRFDEVCHHLVVKDLNTNQVVGCSRIITNASAEKIGHFYSATEFDLSNIIQPDKQYMEIGRTCVDPEYRSTSAMFLLFAGLANFLEDNQLDYLMGCASIPLDKDLSQANAIMAHLRDAHFTLENQRVVPKIPVPKAAFDRNIDVKDKIPPLLTTYLRIGVKVCGEAFLDNDFKVADVFILLDRKQANQRYMKRFFKKKSEC